MSVMLEEIEALIASGNQRMASRQKAMDTALRKSEDLLAAIKKPSLVKERPIHKAAIKVEKQVPPLCPGCGHAIRPNTKFCRECGTNFAATSNTATLNIPLICSCGRPWNEGATFCRHCGAKRPTIAVNKTICPNGHDNTPGAAFCVFCGQKIHAGH